MFKVTRSNTNQEPIPVTVEHVQLGRRVVTDRTDRVLMVDQSTAGVAGFSLYDVSRLLALRLPQFVTFKADNGNYARVLNSSAPNVNFGTAGTALNNTNMMHEILGPEAVGEVRIRSFSSNKCWRSRWGTDPVLADTGSDLTNLPAGHSWLDGIFYMHRIDDDNNVVAIWGFGKYLTRDNNTNNLIPSALSHDNPRARLVMEEAVRSRSMYNVRYNLPSSRVLIGHPQTMRTQTMYNETSLQQTMERTFTYNETKTTTWNLTVSLTFGVSSTVSAGIPFFANGSLTVGWEVSAGFEIGKEHTISETHEDKIVIDVPPMTKVTVSRWESQGTFDVPFSYTQEDTPVTGQRVVSQKHDGLAMGINNFDIFYRALEESLTSPSQQGKEYPIAPQSSQILPPNDRTLADPAAAAAPE